MDESAVPLLPLLPLLAMCCAAPLLLLCCGGGGGGGGGGARAQQRGEPAGGVRVANAAFAPLPHAQPDRVYAQPAEVGGDATAYDALTPSAFAAPAKPRKSRKGALQPAATVVAAPARQHPARAERAGPVGVHSTRSERALPPIIDSDRALPPIIDADRALPPIIDADRALPPIVVDDSQARPGYDFVAEPAPPSPHASKELSLQEKLRSKLVVDNNQMSNGNDADQNLYNVSRCERETTDLTHFVRPGFPQTANK